MAFAHYIASLDHSGPWIQETVDIDASLPKLEKTGRLRAIRRLLPLGRPQYQVLETEGDQTVKRQVIVRYLNAEVSAAEMPASSTAVSPANYKFRYKGMVQSGGATAYAFLITPKKQREGLLKGELWLDAETGTAVRLSGTMVKNPSIFLKRVAITREVTLEATAPQTRTTHLSVDVRFFGRAELTVHESPCTTDSCADAAASGMAPLSVLYFDGASSAFRSPITYWIPARMCSSIGVMA